MLKYIPVVGAYSLDKIPLGQLKIVKRVGDFMLKLCKLVFRSFKKWLKKEQAPVLIIQAQNPKITILITKSKD